MDHIRGKEVAEARAILRHTTAQRRHRHRQAAGVGRRQRGEQLRAGPGRAEDRHRLRRRGPDDQALPSARAGPGHPDPQAHQPHDDHPHHDREGRLMGQKVHPESMRVGYIHDWKSTWFSEKDFADYLLEDIQIREHIDNKLSHAGLSSITIRKNAGEVEVNIHTARPGIVIGKSGSEVDALRKELHKMTNKAVKVNILEIKRPELDAKLVAQSIAEQLVNRVAFRRAMKRSLTSAMRSGAKGVPRAGLRPPRWRRDGPHRGLLRRPRAAAHHPRRHRLRLLRGQDHLRPHRREGLDQQGRDHAQGLRAGPDRARGAPAGHRRWRRRRGGRGGPGGGRGGQGGGGRGGRGGGGQGGGGGRGGPRGGGR